MSHINNSIRIVKSHLKNLFIIVFVVTPFLITTNYNRKKDETISLNINNGKDDIPLLASNDDATPFYLSSGNTTCDVDSISINERKKPSKSSLNFKSELKQGKIGKDSLLGTDNPSDNFFRIYIPENLKLKNTKCFLKYEVYGLDKNSIPSKSINDGYAYGGYAIKKDNKWIKKVEEVNISWLKQGVNMIFFNVPENASYAYQVRDVTLTIEEDDTQGSSILIDNSNYAIRKQDSIYVNGFIKGIKADSIIINGKTIDAKNTFEAFVGLDFNNTVSFKVYSKSQLILNHTNNVEVKKVPADETHDINKNTIKKSKKFFAFEKGSLELNDVLMTLKDSSLIQDKDITIKTLRSIDTPPLKPGMVNVTGQSYAYRFLPDGTNFEKPITLEIPYDKTKIPHGYTEQDIKTFYFDIEKSDWIEIRRDSIQEDNKKIVSLTTHFTDYINGIIKVPESPQTNAFSPTKMNDVKAADPSSEITIIAPPSVSQKGDANISYPIKIPAGRKGMSPKIALQYNSDSNNGWLGIGWNLNVPEIGLDTRWGTPVFNSEDESEIYTLNGEQLMYQKIENNDGDMVDWMPNRHYDASSSSIVYSTTSRSRISQAKFTLRKQNSFSKIERLGNSPNDYYWKVTNTDGTIYWYGGKNGVQSNAVIRDDESNIVKWGLFLVEDVFGNNIKYTYFNFVSSGFSGTNSNLNGGHVFRIANIYYTGFNNSNGAYRVQFINEGSGSNPRRDPIINGRLGIKQVEPGLLREIRISESGNLIRKYILKYGESVFYKSKLEEISEENASGIEFYKHTLEYYDDLEDRKKNLFSSPQNINVPNFNANFTLGFGNLLNASRLNSGEATEFSWHGRAAVGLSLLGVGNDPGWVFTLGALFGENYTKSKGKITLADMDGNGLDDVLYRSGDDLKYFPHEIDGNGNHFFDNNQKTIRNINNFQKTEGKTVTKFGESFDFYALRFYAGKKRFKTEEETEIFITDGNGDLLPDIVNNNSVYFNTGLNSSGVNEFETSSKKTPNMLITANPALISPDDVEDLEPDTNDMKNYDVVRVWVAPRAGNIRIKDIVQFIPHDANSSLTYSIEREYKKYFNVQPQPNCRLYLKTFDDSNATDVINLDVNSNYNPPLGFELLSGSSGQYDPFIVNEGDKIYFRLHKNLDSENDIFITNPVITYVDGQNNYLYPEYDQNNLNRNEFIYEDDYLLSQQYDVNIPGTGYLQIVWDNLNVVNPSDDINYSIVKKETNLINGNITETILYTRDCYANTSTLISPTTLVSNINSIQADTSVSIKFNVSSDSNVDWKSYEWKPKLSYTPDSNASNEGVLSFTKHVVPEYSIFLEEEPTEFVLESNINWQAPNNYETFKVLPNTYNNIVNQYPLNQDDNGTFLFVVKKDGELLGKCNVTIDQGVISLDSSPITIYTGNPSTDPNDIKISFGFYAKGNTNYDLLKKYINAMSDNFGGNSNISKGPVIIGTSYEWNNFPVSDMQAYYRVAGYVCHNQLKQLGSLNRGWGQFIYNDELDDNTGIPSDVHSKLINNTLVLSNSTNLMGFLTSLGIDTTYCTDTYTDESDIEDCINDQISMAFNIPNEGTIDDNTDLEDLVETMLGSVDLSELLNLSAFIPMTPLRYIDENEEVKEKWIGLSDNQYSSPTTMKNGNPIFNQMEDVFTNPDDNESPFLSPDENTGMVAINKVQKSAAKSYSAGWGSTVFSHSKSSYSNSISDFVDINGDRYPDLMTSVNSQSTNMTGGHTSVVIHEHNPLNYNESENSSLSYSGSYPIAGRKKVSSNKQDSGNPKYSAGIGLSANLSGENKERESFMDLNGDGLVDRVLYVNDAFKYKLNLGDDFSNSADDFYLYNSTETHPNSLNVNFGLSGNFNVGNVPFSVSLGYSSSGGNTDVSYQDMNGDGLVDILLFSENTAYVKYNVGNKFKDEAIPLKYESNSYLSLFGSSKASNASLSGSVSQFWGFPICCYIAPIIYLKFGATVGGSANLTVTETERQFRDFNNDGYPDYIKKNGDDITVYYSKIGRTDKLKTVNNPLGGSFTIDYENKKTDYNNPTSKWVMNEVKIDDGYDIVDDGNDAYTMQFDYRDGYYDRRERSFFGYEYVKVNEFKNSDSQNPILYRTTSTRYHNRSYFLQGLVKSSSVEKALGSNTLFSSTQNTYSMFKVHADGTIDFNSPVPEDFDTGGTEGRKQAAVLLTETIKNIRNFSSNQITQKVNMEYDEYGRVVKYVDYGDLALTDDDYYTTIAYHSLNNHILNVPKILQVYNGSSGTDKVRERLTDVNSTTGAINAIRAWLNGSTYAITNLEYDSYGNLNKIVFPNNYNGDAMFYDYEFDSTHNKYITKTVDAFGYESRSTYDSKFDKLLSEIDMAGNETQYTYDTFGRLETVIGPKELAASKPYTIKFEYLPTLAQANGSAYQNCIDSENFVPVAITKHFDVQHPKDDIETITFMDGLARPIQVKKDIVLNTGSVESPQYEAYMSVSGMVEYDEFGRSVKQYHPKKEEKDCAINLVINEVPNPQANYFSETEYDEMNRPLVITDPSGNTSFMEYTIANDGFDHLSLETISTVDQGSQNIITHTFKDARGRTSSTKNIGPSGDIWTKFIYNPVGELIEYIDDQDLSTTSKYDHLGRRVEMEHPDSGVSYFNYDLAGNMLSLTTANLDNAGTSISYKYDFNRLKNIIYPNISGSQNISNVTYKYGDPGSGNQTGRLIFQEDATGTQVFKYGNMGELTFNERTIIAPNLPTRVFTTEYGYDSFNRLQVIKYPDGEKVDYFYDLGGNANRITGEYNGQAYDYVKRVDYDHFEQKTYMLYGNGANQTYTYEPALRRLDKLTAITSDNNTMFNNSYKYDNVGNILLVDNDAGDNPDNHLGGQYHHEYEYDNLNRLIGAEGSFKGYENHNSDYDLSMTYNTTHGIDSKFQNHVQSGTNNMDNTYENIYKYIDGTHQVADIINTANNNVTKSYKYDLNGNIVKQIDFNGDIRDMYWDESNRLRVLAENHDMHHYIYDASGERVLKAASQTEQVYENGEVVNGGSVLFNMYTTYASPYLVINANQEYSKHYYLGAQRIVSKLGEQSVSIFETSGLKVGSLNKAGDAPTTSMDEIKQRQVSDLKHILDKAKKGVPQFKDYKPATDSVGVKASRAPQAVGLYFFHPDHLGSSTFLTDALGKPYQFFINLPFGETMYEQHSYSENYVNPYKFNGKELDVETGLYYYGARYYEPSASIWMSVDPLAEKMPSWSPYSYTFNNPIRYVDPDGRIPIIPWLLKAGAGAAADMLAQASMDYLFNPNTSSWSQAFDNVNWWQVGRSGAEGLIPWRTPGGKIGRAAATATGDVLVNAMNDPSGYTAEQAGLDFATGFVGDLAGGGFGQLLNKYGAKNVANGLMNKLGMNYGDVMGMMGGGLKSINKTVNGITSTRMMKGWADGKVAVIGRGMDNRVIPFADGIGAEYWTGWNPNLSDAENLANNKAWVQGLKEQGYTIYDIGTGPKSNEKGAFYGMETQEIFGDQ